MKPSKLKALACLVLAGLALASGTAHAAVTYTQGDLILGFRSATDPNIYLVDLGASNTYRDATSNISIPTVSNLGADLTTAFGSNWATRNDIYWAIVAARPSVGGPFSGDAAKTTYFSLPESTLGTQVTPDPTLSNTTRGTVTTSINTVGTEFAALTPTSGSGGFAAFQVASTSSWVNGAQNSQTGFGSGFTIEGNGASGIVGTALDLFRVSGSGTGVNTGSYEGTFKINSSGVVSYQNTVAAAPEPSRALLLGAAFGSVVLRRRRA